MRYLTSLLLLFLPLTMLAQPQESVERPAVPEAPDGFSWLSLELIQGSILVPDGWHIRAKDGEQVDAYFISRESLKEVERFTTGLSMNTVYDVEEQTGMSATTFAQKHIEQALKMDSVEVLGTGGDTSSVMKSFIAQFAIPGDDGVRTRVHQINLSNDSTGTVYIMIFEAPEDEWDDAWAIGTKMLGQIRLDRRI